MRTASAWAGTLLLAALLAGGPATRADLLELTDGTVLADCYFRDEGVRYTVWTSLETVGGPPDRVLPRSAVRKATVARDAAWDARPDKPDLTVTYIEIEPKLAGLHGRVQYDRYGRPRIDWPEDMTPTDALIDMGEARFTDPAGAVRNLKLRYQPGEEVTLTAHVKNVGFAAARPFRVEWLIDDQAAGAGICEQSLGEMEETTFALKWRWQDGFHRVTCRIVTNQPEIATLNNAATDPLWAFTFTYIVSRGRVAAWHANRSAYGTFCFEDFYRWHLDIMNLLLEQAVYPATPEGCRARVRLDRIVYADRVQDNTAYVDGRPVPLVAPDGIRYDQGGWYWNDEPEELERGEWKQVNHEWRNQTEWSLPHELGHQLGLVDWYALDYHGHEDHVWPDNGVKVTHFMRYPMQMMHWHGPHLFGEADAAYLNLTIDKPRGYFGDLYFALPRHNVLRIVDINGRAVPDAQVEVFQRGVVVEASAPPAGERVQYYPVVEDGNFDRPVSKDPVIVARTDAHGVVRLPDRPAEAVRTLNGFHRQPNPFGNINVVGNRGLMLIRVTRNERPCYYWLEAHDLVVAWLRGQRDVCLITLQTPYGSADSPPPPAEVRVAKDDEHHARVTWSPPRLAREQHYLDRVIGYRVYRRVGNDGLNDRPWFPVATLGPDERTCRVDLRQVPDDVYWYAPRSERFGVTCLAATSLESELVEVLLREPPEQP